MMVLEGYVLPWGQMSYWGAQVITDFFTAIPFVGDAITTWLRGDFVIDNATLNRFFSLHYLLPFVIVGVVAFHVTALHIAGSNNPDGIDIKDPQDTVPFTPYFTAKDSVGIGVFLIVWASFIFFAPNYLGHPDNYIEAQPLSTPAHIVPEWYFLPFYAILRSITFDVLFLEAKLLGVIAMGASIMILFILPWLDTSKVRSARYRPLYRLFFWVLLVDCIILGIVGAKSPNDLVIPGVEWFEYKTLGLLATIYYFAHFLVLIPIIGKIETPNRTNFNQSTSYGRRRLCPCRIGLSGQKGESLMPRFTMKAALAVTFLFSAMTTAANSAEIVSFPKKDWSWQGVFGTYDRSQLQRGLQAYKSVCAACHG